MNRANKACRTIVVLVTLLCLGCATHYQPVSSPYLVPVQTGTTPDFVRDGQRYEMGYWGSGALGMVAGNPVAEAHVRDLRGQRITSSVFLALTGIAMASSIATIIRMEEGGRESRGKYALASFLLVDVGLIVGLVSLHYQSKAQRTLLDAVNIYNGDVEQQRCCRAYPTSTCAKVASR